MIHRVLATLFVLVIPMSFAPTPAAGQGKTAESETWVPPQTAWGHPDLQGTWSNATRTPLERPTDLGGKEFFTDEEWAERNHRPNPNEGGITSFMPTGYYNDFWFEKGPLYRRTSLILDPPDGKLPPVTPAEQQRLAERTDSYVNAANSDISIESWEDLSAYDRCITRGMPGLMTPFPYNHYYQILQTPDYVAIVVEMIHDARIIPLDGRSHLSPTMPQWLGDSRGRWEGNTLVVETTTFPEKVYGRAVIGADDTVFGGDAHHVVERLTRVGVDTIDYRVTVTNPAVWTGPWTAAIPMNAVEETLFEYACHEGNYGLPNILSGNRAEEAKAAGSR